MNVIYDDTICVAGIGVTPWTRLGLERWLPNYRIVALYDNSASELAHTPPIIQLNTAQLSKLNTQHMVDTEAFRAIASHELADYQFLTYRPVRILDQSLKNRFLMMSGEYSTTFENKAWLRDQLGDQLPFAPYKIYDRSDLIPDRAQYDKLCAQSSSPFVMQHEQLSGGKGTYLVHDFAQFARAMDGLPAKGRVVVSEYVGGAQERSVQCCVTRYGVQRSSLQKQIVRDPALCNLAVPVVNGYCGAEIGTVGASPAVSDVVSRVIDIIGARMAHDGFRGIFGIDFLIRGDRVFLLEINARLTGVTPLLTMTYQPGPDVPFGLLHVLELGGYDYTIEPTESLTQAMTTSQGSMLILQSQEPLTARLARTVPSGVYDITEQGLTLLRKDSRLMPDDPKTAWLVQQYAPTGLLVRPGAKLLAVMTRQPVLDRNDGLLPESRTIIETLYRNIHLEIA